MQQTPGIIAWGFLFFRNFTQTLKFYTMYSFLPLEACPDCLTNIPNGDLKSAVSCLITVGIAAVIRYIELRRIKRKQDKK